MARVLVLLGHPLSGKTLGRAFAEAYVDGARKGGHKVDMFDLAAMTFDPTLHVGYAHAQQREPDLEAFHTALLRADHLVIVFPVWLGSMPALLKGLLERVFQPDLVASQAKGGFPKLLEGKSVRLVATCGMPALLYRWWFGAPGLKILEHNVLRFLGAGPVRTTVRGMVEAVSPATRDGWIEEMRRRGADAR